MALLEERVTFQFRNGVVVVTNTTAESIDVHGISYGRLQDGEFYAGRIDIQYSGGDDLASTWTWEPPVAER